MGEPISRKASTTPAAPAKTVAQLNEIVANLKIARARIAAGPHDPKQLTEIDKRISKFETRALAAKKEKISPAEYAKLLKEIKMIITTEDFFRSLKQDPSVIDGLLKNTGRLNAKFNLKIKS